MKYFFILGFLSFSILAIAQKKELSGATIVRMGVVAAQDREAGFIATASFLARMGGIGTGFTIGAEQSRITGKTAVPLLFEVSTIGKKGETGVKPLISFQAGWLVSSVGGNAAKVSTGGTARALGGARFQMKNGSFAFAQVGYIHQWYSVGSGRDTRNDDLGAFTFQVGFKF
jgi:hypothetical protein